VLVPIALARRDVARPDKTSLRGHGDVMRPADTGFNHAPAPYGNPASDAVFLDSAGLAVAAHAPQFDIDHAARAGLHGCGGVAEVANRFIQADGSRNPHL